MGHRWVTVGLGAVLFFGVAACSSDTPGDGDAPVVDVAVETPDTGDDGQGGVTPERELPEDGGAVSGDMLTLDDYLASVAFMAGVEDPPHVDVIREVDPRERSGLIVECFQEQGIDAYEVAEGGYGTEFPTAQQEAVSLATYVCEAQYPLMPVFYRPFDVPTLDRVYDYFADVVAPCVESAGWDSDLVSREQFITRYQATRELGSDFLGLPDAVIGSCYGEIPAEVILGE